MLRLWNKLMHHSLSQKFVVCLTAFTYMQNSQPFSSQYSLTIPLAVHYCLVIQFLIKQDFGAGLLWKHALIFTRSVLYTSLGLNRQYTTTLKNSSEKVPFLCWFSATNTHAVTVKDLEFWLRKTDNT